MFLKKIKFTLIVFLLYQTAVSSKSISFDDVDPKNFKASELFLFSNATIPEKYFDKFLELKLLKVVLLEYNGV